jgi:hypothetical protein
MAPWQPAASEEADNKAIVGELAGTLLYLLFFSFSFILNDTQGLG